MDKSSIINKAEVVISPNKFVGNVVSIILLGRKLALNKSAISLPYNFSNLTYVNIKANNNLSFSINELTTFS